MAVPAAVALVRQVQSIVESQELLKEQGGVDQVVYLLDCFLDHPDSRARMGAVRTLAQLTARLGHENKSLPEMPQARRILARMESEEQHNNVVDSDAEELCRLLRAALGNSITQPVQREAAPKENEKGVTLNSTAVLRIGAFDRSVERHVDFNEQVRLSISRSLVEIAGVVSVTYDSNEIVVRTRTPDLACDTLFAEDVCVTVEEQLVHCGLSHRHLVVAPVGDSACGDTVPIYLDDSDASEDEICNVQAAKLGLGGTATSTGSHGNNSEISSDGDEPAYLDDSDDDNCGEMCHLGVKGWSIFGRDGWLSLQKIHEYDEDPSLIARLRRAHLRSERKQREEQSRVRRLLSVITPLRNFTQSNTSQ